MPVPQQIELQNGKASADVDLIKTIGAFLLHVLEVPSFDAGSNDARKMFSHIYVDRGRRPSTSTGLCRFLQVR